MNFTSDITNGVDKVVFESIIDTLAGGAVLDQTGFTNADGVVPAGSLVTQKDPTTGWVKIVNNDPNPLGFVAHTVKLKPNTLLAVVIEGAVRKKALPAAVQTNITELDVAMPKITFVD